MQTDTTFGSMGKKDVANMQMFTIVRERNDKVIRIIQNGPGKAFNVFGQKLVRIV